MNDESCVSVYVYVCVCVCESLTYVQSHYTTPFSQSVYGTSDLSPKVQSRKYHANNWHNSLDLEWNGCKCCHTHTHTHIHTHAHIYTHIHTHIHTP